MSSFISLALLINIQAEFQPMIGTAIAAIVEVLQDTSEGLQQHCIYALSELSEHGN